MPDTAPANGNAHRSRPRDTDDDAALAAFGAAIAQRRTARGLSQTALADAAGIDRKTVNRIENGHHAIDLLSLIRLADALRVSPATLVRAAQNPSRDNPPTRP